MGSHGLSSLLVSAHTQPHRYDLELSRQPTRATPAKPALRSGSKMLGQHRLDAFTHARLWRNPCGFAARFNYLGLRYNTPLYGWVEKRFGLSRAEFVIIYSLGLVDGITASEIAVSTAFPKNTLSRAVTRIATLGLIRRSAAETDRRQQNLSLTRKGRTVLDEALPRFIALEAEMLAPLSLVEQETLSALMAKVVLALFDGSAQELQPAPAPRKT